MIKLITFLLVLFSAIKTNCMEINSKTITITNNVNFQVLPQEIILEIIKSAFLTSRDEAELGKSIASICKLNKSFNALMIDDSLPMKKLWRRCFELLNSIKCKFYNLNGFAFNYSLDVLDEDSLAPKLKSSLLSKIKDFIKNKYQNTSMPININDLLSEALDNGNIDLLIIALSNGAQSEINKLSFDSGLMTPLMLCASTTNNKNKEMAQILLSTNGIEIDTNDHFSQTALIWAASRNASEIVKLLLNYGAKIDAQNIYGATALIRAASHGNKETVKLLLDHGADTTLKTYTKKTALDYAKAKNYFEIIQLLQNHQKP